MILTEKITEYFDMYTSLPVNRGTFGSIDTFTKKAMRLNIRSVKLNKSNFSDGNFRV